MRLLAIAAFVYNWSILTNAIQQPKPSKTKASSSLYTTHTGNRINKKSKNDQHGEQQLSSRRKLLCSTAAGVMTALVPFDECSPQLANAAASTTTVSKAFRAYQVQSDSGEKLNPTLKTLTVTF